MISTNPLEENESINGAYKLSLTELNLIEHLINTSVKTLIEIDGHIDSRNYSSEVSKETIKLAHVAVDTLGKFDFIQALKIVADESEHPVLGRLSYELSMHSFTLKDLVDTSIKLPRVLLTTVLAPLLLQTINYISENADVVEIYQYLYRSVLALSKANKESITETGINFISYINYVVEDLTRLGVTAKEDQMNLKSLTVSDFNQTLQLITK